MNARQRDWDVVIVGGGQAGLATGHHLARRGLTFVIVDAGAQIGDQWRGRWDSLRLFTPAQYSSLPGLPNGRAHDSYLSKDEMADYLQSYARELGLPVRLGTRVTALTPGTGGFEITTSVGDGGDGGDGDSSELATLTARQVVIATGANARPHIPGIAQQLDLGIRQMHSSLYRNADAVPPGEVLVVGAGTSGAEIALELAATHPTFLAGRPTPHVPDAVFRLAGGAYWAFVNNVLTLRTPIGRRVASGFHSRGAPLIRISMKEVEAAGVTRLPRLTATRAGALVFDDIERAAPSTVIWATGYQPDLGWLPYVPVGPGGVPVTRRGVVETVPGLYFVGMPFQFALTSELIGGVGRDAAYLADRIADRHAATDIAVASEPR